jgi:MFS family permease
MCALSVAREEPVPTLSTGGRVVLALGALDFGLEQSIILPALPLLQVHYGASVIGIAWLATGFLLAAVVAAPLMARLGDVYGKKRMLLWSLGALALGSLLCALSTSIGVAIAGRVLQGIGAGIAPLALGLARDTVSSEELPRSVGGLIGAANVGGGVGFLLSGLLVGVFAPAALFWFLFAAALVLAAAVAQFVPETATREGVSLDPLGAILLGTGLAAFLLAISKGPAWGWASAPVLLLFVGAAIALAGFGFVEQRSREPLVELRLVVASPFRTTNACAFGFGFTFYIALFVIPRVAAAPTSAGYGLGLSVTEIGLLLVPTSIVGLATAWLAGRLVDRAGSRLLISVGAAIGAGAYIFLAVADGTAANFAIASAAIGVGWGFIMTSVYPIVLRGARDNATAVAAAVAQLFRNVGFSTGVTVAAVVISSADVATAGFARAFAIAAAGGVAMVLLARLLPR